MNYDLKSITIRHILEDPGLKEVVDRHLPGLVDQAAANPMAATMSLNTLVAYSGLPKTAIPALEKALLAYGAGRGLTEAEQKAIQRYQKIAEEDKVHWAQKKTKPDVPPRSVIYPGKIWTDTKGERIQAHGGALTRENGWYYWYGENKEHTTGTDAIWTWGIRMYRSKDLYNWEDLGLIIPPVLDDPASPLYPEQHLDRPHIRKSRETGKYVAWIRPSGGVFVILAADRLTGPYEIVKTDYRPLGDPVGDYDIIENARTGKSFLFMDCGHNKVCGYELADDLLSAVSRVSVQYENRRPPLCREGIALLERDGKYVMFSSSMSGYLPNESDAALSDSLTQPFVSVGDPYVGDPTGTSFHSQFTQCYPVPGTDTVIVLADRWVPGHMLDARQQEAMLRCIEKTYDPEHVKVSKEEQEAFEKLPMLESADTSVADYVWLPLAWKDGRPVLAWQDAWTIR